MANTTVTIVISRLFPSEFQKSVTFIASAKLLRLKCFGSDNIPAISFVISEGFFSAMTTVIYNGNMTVITPAIKRIVTGQFILSFPTFFITTVPPSYR